MKIAVAMSGGVDSSVTAALVKKEGYAVIGITMLIVPEDEVRISLASEKASQVAEALGINHHVIDLRAIFADRIILKFCEQYSLGKTPNPCVQCNKYIKFGVLYEKAKELGADMLATGHYARIERRETDGRLLLLKGIDQHRDQSYFLYGLIQEQLSHTLFPLGNLKKIQVKEIAAEMKLPVAGSESREICFIPDNNYSRFLSKYSATSTRPGVIKDLKGNVLGEHSGIINYTIGQRKRLGIAARQPLYVVAVDSESNTVVVGEKNDIYSQECIVTDVNWTATSGISGEMRARVKIRYLHPEAEAVLTPEGRGRVKIKFSESQMAITPGQSAVFYDGDVVLGGGIIEEVVCGYKKTVVN